MKQYNYQTVSRTVLGDLHTPVSTYLKVRDIFPQSALMERRVPTIMAARTTVLSSGFVRWQASA